MTARLFFKLIFAVLLMMVVALTTIDFLASHTAEDAYISGLKRELEEKARMLASMPRSYLDSMTPESTDAVAKAAGGRFTLIGPDGGVLLDSEADPKRMENHGARPEVKVALQGGTGVSIRESPTIGINFLYVAVPVPQGCLRLAMPLREINAQVDAIRRKLIVYGVMAFIPAILVAAFWARYYSKRLGAIIDYAGTLATGDFRARLKDTGGGELGVLAVQLNETGAKLQKMFEELQSEHIELEKLERVRKDFVINVSHELRTPLASIQGYTETLLDGAIHDRENNVRFLNIIRQNAERLGRLTADLLTLSRIELKTQSFQFASYYLKNLLSDCLDSILPVAEKKRIRLSLEAVEEDIEVFSDSEAVHQIMTNLLDNAVKYTPEEGSITVAARRLPVTTGKPELVEVSVTDTGMGIPADELPRLFERFYRVDKARSRELGGTGLGLAIVKHLVRAMGGEVRVTSILHEGSTFSFTLPVHDLGLPEGESLQTQLTAS